MSFSSDDVNLLVYRYLLESGFAHSAFAFRAESKLPEDMVQGEKPRRGVLINYIQKGLVYTEIETHIKPDGGEVNCRVPFSLTQPHVCREERTAPPPVPAGAPPASATASIAPPAATSSDGVYQVLDVEVSKLVSHSGEVFACQWNPRHPNILATGASDATAVLWSLPRGKSCAASGKVASESKKVLPHAPLSSPSRDVTTLEWSPDGQLLATGSYDGTSRLWTLNGSSAGMLTGHAGPIFSLRWTTDAKYILSGGVDRSARIWDVKTCKEVKRFNVHSAPTLDVAWRDNTSFATCSSDKTVTLCRWDREEPLQRWEEHTDEVNAVVWEPTMGGGGGGPASDVKFLASCSDDKTIRIWTPNESKSVQTLAGHEREIYTVRWRPGTRVGPRLLSASFDGTARLWEVETGKCVRKFPRHKQPVYAIEFSPDGQFCVVGSFDRSVEVLHVETGRVIESFSGPAGVFDVDWSASDKIACATAKGAVTIWDFRRPSQPLTQVGGGPGGA